MKVAIVGAGPRGLWAVEELTSVARDRGVGVDIDVYDADPGRVWNTPEELLLNVRSSAISSGIGSFNEWRGSDDPYPPRSLVGQFLAASWQAVETYLPPNCTLTYHRQQLTELPEADEILLTTGHESTWPGELSARKPYEDLSDIGPDDVVLVRGAALTFIDVTRMISPRRIVPVSRSGRFMEVKPLTAGVDIADIVASGQAAICASSDIDEFRTALAEASEQILKRAGGTGDVTAVLDGTDFAGDPAAELRLSHQVATGEAPMSAACAVGIAWRELYPAVIDRASYEGRDSLEGFGDLTRTLERVGFGPPPESTADLLELIDSGVVDTSYMGRGNEDIYALGVETGATVIIDAVLPPPGVVPGSLCASLDKARIRPGTTGLDVERDGTVVGYTNVAAIGRMTEGMVLGNDSLNRSLHGIVPAWARRVIAPSAVHGTPPLTARVEPWAQDLLHDVLSTHTLLDTHASPVNVLNSGPMKANIQELVDAGEDMGVETRIFFARKANKALTFVDTVRDLGHGVDVASERELAQVLARGVPGDRIILSAAVKTDALLTLAIENDVTISGDSCAEVERISARAQELGITAHVAPRLAPDPATMPPTRFGERSDTWANFLSGETPGVEIVGLHVHLHGYAAADRSAALRECLDLVDRLDHDLTFIDLGGGVPMSYLDDASEWENYHHARTAMVEGYARPFTWKSDPLSNTYPYHQSPTRGPWLREVLGDGIAEEMTRRGLRLHLEPGRSLLDGCGLILATVAFVKERSDGVPLVGLEMNRTQCRTTSDDYLVDPILVKNTPPSEEIEAFLVGAYCIEDEVILRRRIRFPDGIAPGDVIGIPNTAGYFMHILESASHQIPLAKNVVYPEMELDLIDR